MTITMNSIGTQIPIEVAKGGTGAQTLTVHGLLVGATTGAIEAMAAGTAGQVVLSGGASANPTYSTFTIATTGAATDGQVLIGKTADGSYNAAVLTEGANITITNAGGSITIAASVPTPFAYSVKTGATVAAVAGNGYFCNNATIPVALTLPATAAIGNIIEIIAMNANGWTLAQNALQYVAGVGKTSTIGITGSLASTGIGDTVRLVCNVTDVGFYVVSMVGNVTVV